MMENRSWCPICLETSAQVFLKSEPAVETPIGEADLDEKQVDIVRCVDCRAVFVRRDFPEELLDRFYTRVTGGGIALNMENFGWWLQNTEGAIQDLLRLVANEKRGPLLDVGCGRGTLVYLARQHGWEVTGLDINADMARFVKDQLGIPALSGALEDSALPFNHFAVITLFDVLEHVYAPIKMLERCKELLRPGGVLIVKSPHGKMQLFKENIRKRMGLGTGNIATIGHINQFDTRSLNRAFQKAGLTPIGVFPASVFLPAMRGAPFNLRRTIDYGLKVAVNNTTDIAFRVSGLNAALNLMGIARKRSNQSTH
jgi:2-polyprenyl-3-methyl-5-hydroxy-6-metoxy-1,4-benzoquinol methylase